MVNFCLCLEEPLFLILSEDEISTYSCQEMEPLHSMLDSILRIELNWRIFASKQCSCMEGVLCSTRTAKQILPLHHAHQDLKLKKIIILLNIICNNITILSVIICGKTDSFIDRCTEDFVLFSTEKNVYQISIICNVMRFV